MAKVVITGATGLIGQKLVRRLAKRGDEVVALSRDAEKARRRLGDDARVVVWKNPLETMPPTDALAGSTAVVNLMGEPISQRWTPAVKERIRDSRIIGTRRLVEGLLALKDEHRPEVLVSQSATGYYGPRDAEPLDEEAPPGNDFLARVVVGWELETVPAEASMRVVRARTGVVLSARDGAIATMLPFFRAGIGGPVAGGDQYVPWIHLTDVVDGLIYAIDSNLAGPVNLVAPGTVTNREFCKSLGRALRRPAVLPVPALVLRLIYGEMAQLVTTGQRAIPKQLLSAGFEFRRADVGEALDAVVGAA